MRKVYLLHSKEGLHMIASNFKAVFLALRDIQDSIERKHFRSYSWYCFYMDNNQDVAIPRKGGGYYTVSRRPILSKYIGHLKKGTCTIPSFKNPSR